MSATASRERLEWSRLNPLQVGHLAEQYVSMAFTVHGFSVFRTEVDDRGIDMVVRTSGGTHYDVQVKSVRGLNYVFFPKASFPLADSMLGALVIFFEGKEPDLYLIASIAWREPNDLLVSRDYEGKKSKPDWGLNLSQRNLHLLKPYRFDEQVGAL